MLEASLARRGTRSWSVAAFVAATVLCGWGLPRCAGAQPYLPDPASPAYYGFGAVAGQDVLLRFNADVIGDVHANDDVFILPFADVTGNVSAVDWILNLGSITGSSTQGAPPVLLPTLPTEAEARAMADRIFEGNTEFGQDEVVDDVVFVDGDVRYHRALNGTGAVIAMGDIRLKKGSPGWLDAGTSLTLVAHGDIRLDRDRDFRGVLVAGEDLEIKKRTDFEGVAIAHWRLDASWASDLSEITLDSQGPVVSAPMPPDGASVTTATPTVSAAWTDDVSGVDPDSLSLLVDGVERAAEASSSASGFSWTSSTPLSEGSHAIALSVADHAGNVSATAWSFSVDLGPTDTEPPELVIVEPAVPTPRNPFRLLITYSDADSGVDTESLEVDLGSTSLLELCVVDATSATCSLAGLDEGTHLVEIAIADVAGNTSNGSIQFEVVLDEIGPTLVVESPLDGTLTAASSVAVSGTASDANEVSLVTVNGEETTLVGDDFSGLAELVEGENTLTLYAYDSLLNSTSTSLTVVRDSTPPVLQVQSPEAGSSTNSEVTEVTGSVTDVSGTAAVIVDGQSAELQGDQFSATVALDPGINLVAVEATDALGNSTTVDLSIERFAVPSVVIDEPSDLEAVSEGSIDVVGRAGPSAVSVLVNGVSATLDNGVFTADAVPLIVGGNVITAIARDALDHASAASVMVVRDATPPRLSVLVPADGESLAAEATVVSGVVVDPGGGSLEGVTVEVQGVLADVSHETFRVDGVSLTLGDNLITVTATDEAGNQASEQLSVSRIDPSGAHLAISSGSGQTGVVREELSDQLVVQALAADGTPQVGVPVLFEAVDSDGLLGQEGSLALVYTDSSGLAATTFQLGGRAGSGFQRVQAGAVGFGTPVVFDFLALPASPSRVLVDAGTPQTGVAGQPLAMPFAVVVTDRYFNRLEGLDVTFSVEAGSGLLDSGATSAVKTTDFAGRATVTLSPGDEPGEATQRVVATVPGLPTSSASFVASVVTAGDPADTSISGVVIDNTGAPIEGVTVAVDSAGISVETGSDGTFVLSEAPIGVVHLRVDGVTALRPGDWPELVFVLPVIPGVDNQLPTPVYLLPVDVGGSLFVDETTGGVLEIPDLPGFELEVAADSVVFPDGSRSGTIRATAVHTDRVPMTPTFGQQPRFVVTIQPPGAVFDPPARVSFPNVYGMAPGASTELFSFDHDVEQFVSIGPGVVTSDGARIVSLPGLGVVKAGWHDPGDAGEDEPGCTSACSECQVCDAASGGCVADASASGFPCGNSLDPCFLSTCVNGTCVRLPIETVDVELSANPPSVRPGGTTEITASVTPPCPGKVVTFTAEAVENSGGHQHSGRPLGTLSPSSCTTDASGSCSVNYTATDFGGEERVRGEVSGLEDTVTLDVLVPGLVLLGSGSHTPIGATSTHPVNHYGAPDVIGKILAIAAQYATEFPNDMPIMVNDISLERGGKFDINGNWSRPHQTHREGRDIDVRLWSIPLANRARFQEICEQNGAIAAVHQPPHYHLDFP